MVAIDKEYAIYFAPMGNHNSGNFRKEKMSMTQRAAAVRAVHGGKKVSEIAYKYKVSTQYIYSLLVPKKYKTLRLTSKT